MDEEKSTQPNCYALCAKFNPIRQRYIATIMGALGLVNTYVMRQCLSPIITQLVIPRNDTIDITAHIVCERKEKVPLQESKGTKDWNQELQTFILSSFYIGYFISHIPGGILADKYGSKWVLVIANSFAVIFTLLTPLAIERGGPYGLVAIRILVGLSSGPIFPALSVLVADWAPPRERSFLGSVVFGAGQLGTILANSMSGLMLLRHEWSVVFYVWGAIAALWCIFFVILCSSSPLMHPCITDEEREYLQKRIGFVSANRRRLPPAPLKKILSSIPMWVLIITQMGHDWAFYIILAYLPKYMSDIVQIHSQRTVYLSSIPPLMMWICSIVSGITADILINRKILGRTTVRKIMTGLAAFGPAIFMMSASYAVCNEVSVIWHFCVCMGLMGTYYGGMKLAPIDMSPNYAGTVMAITNGVGAGIGFLAPQSVGWLTTHTSINEWRTVFWLAFCLLYGSGMVYCIWANSDLQPWNNPRRNEKT